MASCFTSKINASSGIGARHSRDGKGLGFPITARCRICWVTREAGHDEQRVSAPMQKRPELSV
jgi:hypothetical protein